MNRMEHKAAEKTVISLSWKRPNFHFMSGVSFLGQIMGAIVFEQTNHKTTKQWWFLGIVEHQHSRNKDEDKYETRSSSNSKMEAFPLFMWSLWQTHRADQEAANLFHYSGYFAMFMFSHWHLWHIQGEGGVSLDPPPTFPGPVSYITHSLLIGHPA